MRDYGDATVQSVTAVGAAIRLCSPSRRLASSGRKQGVRDAASVVCDSHFVVMLSSNHNRNRN